MRAAMICLSAAMVILQSIGLGVCLHERQWADAVVNSLFVLAGVACLMFLLWDHLTGRKEL